jgi:hypothetical protein
MQDIRLSRLLCRVASGGSIQSYRARDAIVRSSLIQSNWVLSTSRFQLYPQTISSIAKPADPTIPCPYVTS